MRRLKFHYEMELTFDQPVTEHHYAFRCLPMEDRQQSCYGLTCDIRPSGRVDEFTDGFGNRTCAGEAMAPHDSLRVESGGIVFVDRRRETAEAEDAHPLFRFASAYTVPDQGIWRYLETAREGWKREDKGMDFLLYLMDRLHGTFSYAPGTTDVTTTAAQALAGGRGVCQDYAHIFLALCRLGGYPARYVAGMMEGEGATHAWAEIYAGGRWTGFDPTNNRLADDGYIKLSHGRDFGDCTVDKGCFKGFAAQKQTIYVKVEG